MNGETQENKMGVMPVNKLLMSMALPMMISMLVQAMYNIVDSIFVSRICEDALTAVSISFPVQNFMIATAAGTGVGINALLSKSLGQKNQEKVNKSAMNGLFLLLIGYVIFLLIGLFALKAFYRSQTNDEVVIDYAVRYMRICAIFSFGMFAQFGFERILQSTGRTIYTMITQGTGALINIFLDPMLIFGIGFFPKLGIEGAAVATVIGQIIAGTLAYIINKKKNPDVTLTLKGFRPDGRVIGKILGVGIPSIIMASIGSVMTYGMNRILMTYFTKTAAAVFGVYFKLNSFVFMPVFGMNNGLVPIIAYNYGAGKRKRVVQAIKWGELIAFIIMLVGTIVIEIIPGPLLRLFDASDNMMEIGIPALRIIAVTFVFASYGIVCSSVFQSLGHGLLSMFVSLLRQLIILLPVAYLFARTGTLYKVWLSFPIAEGGALILSTIFLVMIFKKVINKIGLTTEA